MKPTERLFQKRNALFLVYTGIFLIMNQGCQNKSDKIHQKDQKIHLITLDPGHFHAALLQKSMYSQIDPVVHVYAPEGPEVKAHLNLIESYNSRSDSPTSWKEKVYTGSDYLKKMFSDKRGNVIVLAGNNRSKTEYIRKAVGEGFNVLADKPMAIDSEGFNSLEAAFTIAKRNNVLLYDIMTARYDIINMLQKELSKDVEVFGKLEKGTAENPAVIKESVHYFLKYVSDKPLVRPAWFFDVEQAGNGIVDITTHLVDLVQWECFPEVALNYKNDIKMLSAKRWPTKLTLPEFKKVTQNEDYPAYLQKDIQDGALNVFSNGEMNYTIKDVHTRISVIWNFQAPQGTGDTHYSILRGTKANLVVRQGKEQQYKPVLFIEPVGSAAGFERVLKSSLAKLHKEYPGIEVKRVASGWEVLIPDHFNIGHEAQFAEVTKKYLQYLETGKLPEWEIPNMLAKYYTTTQALEKSKGK